MAGDTISPSRRAISAAVLAGGQSSRLGADKALLTIDGQPLLAHVVHKLTALSDDVMIVTNTPSVRRYEPLGLPARLLRDERPGLGSLMGVYSALNAACHPYTLVVACDMPFLNLPLLRYMWLMAPGHDVVIPRVGSLLEPLHAIYSRNCLPAIARLLDKGERKVVAFFPWVKVRYINEREIDPIDPQHLSFVNVNTPEDWQRIQTLLNTRSSSPR
jgi:molybdenum cofactor guanylyltransferase